MPRKKAPAKAKTRRASGTGALFFSESRQVWVGRAVVGRKPDGSPQYVERSHAKQDVVIARLKDALPPGPDVTLGAYAARWIRDMELRERTVAARRNSVVNHITPVLGGVRVCDLTPGQVERAARTWAANVGSANTVRLILDHLSTLMGEAVREGLRADNPAKLARRPKPVKTEIDPFAVAELGQLVERGGVVALLAATGLRAGEACALDVTDYDPVTRLLRVTKTQSVKGTVGPPKSANGTRTLTVPTACAPHIVAAIGSRASGPLFLGPRGDRIGHKLIARQFDAAQAALGLRRRNPHQARHSVATALIAAGVPLGDVARWIGDSVQTLVRVYLHPSSHDVGATMEAIIGGTSGGRKVGADSPGAPK